MKRKANTEIFDAYQIQVTRQMCKILIILYLVVGPGIWAGTAAGFFFAENIPVLMSVGFIVCFLPAALLKLNVQENIVKYFAVISQSLLVNFLFISNVKIQISFLMMPVLATMYFDRKFILKMSALNFLCIVGAIIIVNPRYGEMYAKAGLIGSAGDYLVERLLSYSLELAAMTIVLVSVAGFARRLMEKLAEAEKEKHRIDIAEARNKAKGEFLAAMSHEIRTPMNAILGIAQIQLQKDDLPDEYALALDKIYGSGESLLGIINDILDMSKIESGKFEINPSEYDMPSLINDAIQLNIVRIGSKPIEFLLDIDENLPSKLFGDELRLKQILNNLLSNAIKYTDKGYVKLSVNHSVMDGGDITLRFTVEDTGQGMKSEDQKRLFSEYSRFNADTNRGIEGTGLGLNISMKLVEMMAGTIKVQSEYGKGSTFIAEVRQQAVEYCAIGAELAERLRNFTFASKRQISKLQITRFPMPYGKVLVVDDVDSNLYVAVGLLTPYKLNIETANSGFEAISKIESGKIYDVIFMDHMMPQMDGIQTTQKLRESGYTGTIVALTANALVGNGEMFKQSGFDGFIPKPIDLRHLNAVLNKFIRDRYPEEAEKYNSPMDVVEPVGAADPKLIQIFCRDAEKAVVTLRETITNGDIKLFTTTVHAIKPVLANLGENEASDAAFMLEKAGLSGDKDYILSNTENFINTLADLIQRLNPPKTAVDENSGATEDTAYLTEQLKNVQFACKNYNAALAYVILDLLKEKAWKAETSAALEQIHSMLFLHSDFEGVCEQIDAFLGN